MEKKKGVVRFSACAEEALSACARTFNSPAILIADSGAATIASMTWMGPAVFEPARASGIDAAFEAARDTVAKGRDAYIFAEEDAAAHAIRERFRAARIETSSDIRRSGGVGVVEAVAAFRSLRPETPVRRVNGREIAMSWSVAHVGAEGEFHLGDVLDLYVEPMETRTVLRWRGEDERDAGVHVVLERPLSDPEKELVKRSKATVTRLSYGLMPSHDGSGTLRVCTLALDVPGEFARAFADGHMPRHGIVDKDCSI